MPKENIKAVYRYLLNEGVIVIKKEEQAPKHLELPIPNIQVINVLKSLKSRGCVTEQFSWSHFYYCLTDDGIIYLRKYLHLPDNVVPATVAKSARSSNAPTGGNSSSNVGSRREGRGNAESGTWRAKVSA